MNQGTQTDHSSGSQFDSCFTQTTSNDEERIGGSTNKRSTSSPVTSAIAIFRRRYTPFNGFLWDIFFEKEKSKQTRALKRCKMTIDITIDSLEQMK